MLDPSQLATSQWERNHCRNRQHWLHGRSHMWRSDCHELLSDGWGGQFPLVEIKVTKKTKLPPKECGGMNITSLSWDNFLASKWSITTYLLSKNITWHSVEDPSIRPQLYGWMRIILECQKSRQLYPLLQPNLPDRNPNERKCATLGLNSLSESRWKKIL